MSAPGYNWGWEAALGAAVHVCSVCALCVLCVCCILRCVCGVCVRVCSADSPGTLAYGLASRDGREEIDGGATGLASSSSSSSVFPPKSRSGAAVIHSCRFCGPSVHPTSTVRGVSKSSSRLTACPAQSGTVWNIPEAGSNIELTPELAPELAPPGLLLAP